MRKVSQAILVVLLLSACLGQPPTGTPTLTPQPSATVASTPGPGTRASEYKDTWLCFAVEVPEDWSADGAPGGFATFAPAAGETSFNIANVALEETTLEQALVEVQRGPLGIHIQEVKDFTLAAQPARWITFTPDTQFRFVVLVIAPDCGDGSHALFISASGAEQEPFESFLKRIQFVTNSQHTPTP